MKKTKLSTANTGGIPFQALDFQFIQDESWKGIASTLKELQVNYPYGFVIQGCIASSAMSGLNISEGYVFLNGDIIYFPAQLSVPAPFTFYEGTPTPESRNYESGAAFTFAETKTVSTTVSAGDSVIFTSTNDQRTYLKALTSQPRLKNGSYTATVLSTTNISGVGMGLSRYIVVGNFCHVMGYANIDHITNNTNTSMRISIPIASTGVGLTTHGTVSGYSATDSIAGSLEINNTSGNFLRWNSKLAGATTYVAWSFIYPV